MAGTHAADELLTEARARELAGRVLALSSARETFVTIRDAWTGNTRSAVNRITTAGEVRDTVVSVTARDGRREATVTTNRLDEPGLRAAAEAAAEQAGLAPENPELAPLLGPQEYEESRGFHGATAELGPEARSRVAADAIAAAARDGLEAAGFLTANASATAVASSTDLFAWHRATSVDYELTVRPPDGSGSGWAGAAHRDWAEVDIPALHGRAVERAVRSREPAPLAPGDYPVVFTAEAVSDLVGLLAGSLDARAADEGRSAFSAPDEGTKVGERLLDPKFTLVSDPVALGSAPWQGDGLPLRRQAWFEEGRLARLSYDRYWAGRRGVEPTGRPGSLRMSGGDATLEELVRGLDRGLLVTRLWYIRRIDPRTILYTGLTRDGVFLVEGGEVVRPVNNFRWNDSPLAAFASIEALGRPRRVAATREVPPARLSSFHFSTVSEAV
ncbi:MAG: metallopeptidase TldD-related protein [Gemmatimonadota bacterium]|nr:metallopeptidase TldD-related protein [Gemmatimonadota bacterium]